MPVINRPTCVDPNKWAVARVPDIDVDFVLDTCEWLDGQLVHTTQPRLGSPYIVGFQPGKPYRLTDTGMGQTVELLDGSTVQLARVVAVIKEGEWPTREPKHVNGDPYDCRPENIITDPEEMTAEIAASMEAGCIARERALIEELRAAMKLDETRDRVRVDAQAAREATEAVDAAYAASEHARRAGAPAGRVAVLEAVALDEQEAEQSEGYVAGLERVATSPGLSDLTTMAAPDPTAQTFRSRRAIEREKQKVAPA